LILEACGARHGAPGRGAALCGNYRLMGRRRCIRHHASRARSGKGGALCMSPRPAVRRELHPPRKSTYIKCPRKQHQVQDLMVTVAVAKRVFRALGTQPYHQLQKSMIGPISIGESGAVEAAATALLARARCRPPTINPGDSRPRLRTSTMIPNTARESPCARPFKRASRFRRARSLARDDTDLNSLESFRETQAP